MPIVIRVHDVRLPIPSVPSFWPNGSSGHNPAAPLSAPTTFPSLRLFMSVNRRNALSGIPVVRLTHDAQLMCPLFLLRRSGSEKSHQMRWRMPTFFFSRCLHIPFSFGAFPYPVRSTSCRLCWVHLLFPLQEAGTGGPTMASCHGPYRRFVGNSITIAMGRRSRCNRSRRGVAMGLRIERDTQ